MGGIGKVLEKVLSAFNMTSMNDVRENMPKILSSFTPAVSEFLLYSSLGISPNEGEKKEVVDEHSLEVSRKTLGAERTFSLCCESFSEQKLKLKELSLKVCAELKEKSLWGKTVTLKLKTIKFELLTRSVTNKNYFQCADVIEKMTVKLLSSLVPIKIRLIGITISKFIQKPTTTSSSSSSSSSNPLSSFFKLKNITTTGNESKNIQNKDVEKNNMTKNSNILDFHDDVGREDFDVCHFDDTFDKNGAIDDHDNDDNDDDYDNNNNNNNNDYNDDDDEKGQHDGESNNEYDTMLKGSQQEDVEIVEENSDGQNPFGGKRHLSHDSMTSKAQYHNMEYNSNADIHDYVGVHNKKDRCKSSRSLTFIGDEDMIPFFSSSTSTSSSSLLPSCSSLLPSSSSSLISMSPKNATTFSLPSSHISLTTKQEYYCPICLKAIVGTLFALNNHVDSCLLVGSKIPSKLNHNYCNINKDEKSKNNSSNRNDNHYVSLINSSYYDNDNISNDNNNDDDDNDHNHQSNHKNSIIRKNAFEASSDTPSKRKKLVKNEKKVQNNFKTVNNSKITNFLFHANH